MFNLMCVFIARMYNKLWSFRKHIYSTRNIHKCIILSLSRGCWGPFEHWELMSFLAMFIHQTSRIKRSLSTNAPHSMQSANHSILFLILLTCVLLYFSDKQINANPDNQASRWSGQPISAAASTSSPFLLVFGKAARQLHNSRYSHIDLYKNTCF